VPLKEVAFARGLVPRSSWLEVSAAMSTGRLSEALEAAAARETDRFSRAWSPGMARGSLAYFGVLWGLLVLIFGFVMYYIVPKFKKILDDFDLAAPPPMRSFLNIMDSDFVMPLFVLFGLSFLILAITVELLVDYYGWEGMLERFGSRFRLRFSTPDLLRGLKWAVLTRKPFDAVLQDMATTPVTFLVKSGLHRAAGGLRQGEDPWTVLHNVGWIRREEAELLRCAQAAGNLPWALETLSQSIGQRRSYRVEWWLQASHPVLVLTAAAFVGWFAVAMFSPLTHMLNELS
jgi:type IV pilus assembly protein PilC